MATLRVGFPAAAFFCVDPGEFPVEHHGHGGAGPAAAHVGGEQGVVFALAGAAPPVFEHVGHHQAHVVGVFVVKAGLDGVVDVVVGEVIDLVADGIVGPVGVAFPVKPGQVIVLHRPVVDGGLKVHLEAQDVAVGDGFPDGVGVEQGAEDVLGAQAPGGFVEHGGAGVAHPGGAPEGLLDGGEVVPGGAAVGLVDDENNVFVRRGEAPPPHQGPQLLDGGDDDAAALALELAAQV